MPKATRPTKPRRFIRQVLILGAFAVAAVAGALSGVLFAYSPDLPEISDLDRYTPGTITRLYARGGELIGEFATERREAANTAVQAGLRAHDKRRGFRPPARNIIEEATVDNSDDREPADVLAAFDHRRWVFAMDVGDIVPAVVTDVDHEAMQVRFGSYGARVVPKGLRTLDSGLTEGFRGIGRTPADQLVQPGDLIEVKIMALHTTDADGHELDEPVVEADLEQAPLAEGALLAIENRTGRILAMVGGYSFDRSKFNRATQAYRQLGSLFKGVLYAAAIDQGYTPTSIVPDEPVSYDVGPFQARYRPTNYDYVYEGPITLRRAFEHSRNVPAVWMMSAVGPEIVVDFARRLGFTSPIPPFLSVALGSAEATLQEVTSAYSVFPNRGTRMIPYQIERIVDRAGAVLEEGGGGFNLSMQQSRPVYQQA